MTLVRVFLGLATIAYSDGYSGQNTNPSVLCSPVALRTSQVSVTGSITETTILSYVSQANNCGSTGAFFRFTASGTYDNPSDTSPTACTFKLKIGSTVITSVAPVPPASTAQTNKGWAIVAYLTLRSFGSAGTCIGSLDCSFSAGATIANAVLVGSPSATQTFNTTIANTIALTMTLGSTTAGYVVRAEQAVIDRCG